ncbi:hypothetical protein Acr_23g0012220 [Actinidia rufa]|uniref:Uncharacterized protein n=1 Tax=Actinidia rufa TaxID=165716 RepID=A0A7J0GPU3_9ERIC|nr:hypothetical protein Acr_23g0012220 [Actinidia rufa]
MHGLRLGCWGISTSLGIGSAETWLILHGSIVFQILRLCFLLMGYLMLRKMASNRRRNEILSICDEHGNKLEDPAALKRLQVLTGNYWELITPEEVRKAVFSITGNKARGLDGFNASLYHKNWDLVWPALVTTTALTFVSKTRCPISIMNGYRPNACCDAPCKSVTKILATKLILPSITNLSWATFIKVMEAMEFPHLCIHWIKAVCFICKPSFIPIKYALEEVCYSSGHHPNLQKSSIFFSEVNESFKDALKIILPIPQVYWCSLFPFL